MIYAACRPIIEICRPRMFSGEYLWIYIAILVRRRSGNDGVYLVNLSIYQIIVRFGNTFDSNNEKVQGIPFVLQFEDR